MESQAIREILDLVRLCTLSMMLVIVVYTDLSKGKVYNWCSLGGLVFALGLAFLYNNIEPPENGPNYNFTISLYGFISGCGVMFLFFLLGGVKFADVKLMAAVGAFMGYPAILLALVMTALVGAVTAFAILIWKGKLSQGLKRSFGMLFTWRAPAVPESKEEQEKQGFIMMPYGFAIAVGSLGAIIYGQTGGISL